MRLKKKVVVIGGTGFIGTYLAANLHKHTDIDLSVFYRKTAPQIKLPGVNYYQFKKTVKNSKTIKIINNAFCLVFLNQPDIGLIKSLLESKLNIKKIIYTSTLLLYKNSNYKQKENSPIKPLTDYENNKYMEEKLLSSFAKRQQIKFCILRLANVYGDVKNRGIIQKIFNALLKKEVFVINGNGEQKRDYIFIEDVTNILEKMIFLSQRRIINIFNVCTGRGYTINELITIIEKITKKKLLRENVEAISEKKVIIGNNNKIIKYTHQHLHFSLQQGLKKTYENYLN